jgi:hypothetical protein
MKPIASVYRWLFLPALFIFAAMGCHSSLAAPPSPAAPNPPGPTVPQPPGPAAGSTAPAEAAGASSVLPAPPPRVLDADPLAKSLLNSLRIAGKAHPGELKGVQAALKETLDTQGVHAATPLERIQCFGTDDAVRAHERDRNLHNRQRRADNDKERMKIRSLIPRDGCFQNVRYAKAEDVVAFDRIVLGPRSVATPFYTWGGSNGHTAPRWEKDAHGNKTIVATWYFLLPEAERYDAPGTNNKTNHKDAP